ncbi:unnamed protein product [Rotaria sordida]|uniref:Uncharacterized protein n=2 Tax=Rotaria sordida TaxID=392033 RepID=A0A814I6C4_9BILA|nr:unnamed protein product [Rotaria sordida]
MSLKVSIIFNTFLTFYLISCDDVQREFIQPIEYLPNICTELANGDKSSILSLKFTIEFYTEFMKDFHSSSKSDNEQFLLLINYLIENRNTIVY